MERSCGHDKRRNRRMKRRICALFTVLCMMVLCVPAAFVTDAEAAKAVSIAFESKGYTVEP